MTHGMALGTPRGQALALNRGAERGYAPGKNAPFKRRIAISLG